MKIPAMRLLLPLSLALVAACGGGGGGSSQDTRPNTFSFTAQIDVATGVTVDSPAVTISGINAAAAVSIVGGQYSINGGAFTSTSGSISNGQSLVVRVMASSSTNTSVSSTITVGGVSATFTVTTAPDTTPNALGPFGIADVAPNAVVDFPAVTVDGIDVPIPISIASGEYSIDGGAFTTVAGTIDSGQSIVVRVIAAGTTNTAVTATVTVGGVDVDFTATTLADTLPDVFSFADQVDVAPGAVVDSGTVVISGVEVAVAVSIIGGEYSIDGAPFTSADGMIVTGQSLELRVVAETFPGGIVNAVVMVGDGSAVWTVTTLPDTTAPTATITFPPLLSRTSGDTVYLRGTALDDMSTIAAIRVNGVDAATNDAYANWTAAVSVVPGDNVLDVQTEDTAGNFESSAAQIAVTRNGRFGAPAGIAYDGTAEIAYVVDSGMHGLWAVDLATGGTGLRTIVSDGGTPNGFDTFVAPVSVALDGGRALVLDPSLGAVLSVDLASGERTIFSDASTPDSTNPFVSLHDTVLDPSGNRLLVLDNAAGPGSTAAVFAVDLTDGARTIVSDANTPDATNLFQNARGIALDSAGNRALVVTAYPNAVYTVDLATGARAILSDDSTPNGNSPLTFPSSIRVDATGARALVGQPETQSIMEVSLVDGARMPFSADSVPDSANLFDSPGAMAIDAAGNRVLVLDDVNRGIYAADLNGGARTILSPDDPPTVTLPFLDPSGILLDPANNRALVSDTERDAIIAMDLDTLDMTIFSNNAFPTSANPFYWPARIAGDLASNRAFVLDRGDPGFAAPQVLALDLTTGARTLVTSDTFPDANNPLTVPFGIAFDETYSRLLVSDVNLMTVFAVDVNSGVRTIFSDNTTPDASNPFAEPQPIVIDAANGRALIGNSTSSFVSSLLAADLPTGGRTVLSGYGIPDIANWFSNPVGLALDAANDRVLLMDRQVRQLLSVSVAIATPTTGERTVISNNLAPFAENPIGGPEGVAYDPATGILYVADDWFDAVMAIDVVTGRRVYMMR